MSPSRNTSTDDDALWQTQRDQLKALHQDLLRAPVPEALQTAAATLPPAMEVKAMEDCTVAGRKHKNNNP